MRWRGIRRYLWAAGGAGGAHLPVGRGAKMKCLTATADLEEELPPPPRHEESNPDLWWLMCHQRGPANRSFTVVVAQVGLLSRLPVLVTELVRLPCELHEQLGRLAARRRQPGAPRFGCAGFEHLGCSRCQGVCGQQAVSPRVHVFVTRHLLVGGSLLQGTWPAGAVRLARLVVDPPARGH